MSFTKSRRRHSSEVTPRYEDSGLFKKSPTDLKLSFVPRIGSNSRGDIVIKGFVSDRGAIDVVFAGRRKPQAAPLVQTLRQLWQNANTGLPPHVEPPEAEDIRLPAQVLGSWRPRFEVDDQGWQTHEYQLLAARWAFSPQPGTTETYGEAPLR